MRKALLIALIACMAVCSSVAIAACGKNSYPDYREPAGGVISGPTAGDEFSGNYVVSVVSAGGLPLNGVKVTAKQNGVPVISGMSIGGKVQFTIDPGEYELEVDESTLPEGYYVPEGKEYALAADKAEATVAIPSKIITASSTVVSSYSLGDVIHDFVYTNSDGSKLTLEQAMEGKSAVILNFWYVNCSWCVIEFPYLNESYSQFSDKVSVVALSVQDSVASIAQFKEEKGLSFNMGYDMSKITSKFGVTAFPTTVVVDRYGVIAAIHSEAITNLADWNSLFNTYTSDDYTQTGVSSGTGDDEGDTAEYAKPDSGLKMGDSEQIIGILSGDGAVGKITNVHSETNEDADYAWPWIIDSDSDGDYITASNSNVHYSFAIIYFDISLKAGETFSFEYFTDTEVDNDVLYVIDDTNQLSLGAFSGDTKGWITVENVYTADRDTTFTVGLCYIKDQKSSSGTDTVGFKNICIYDIANSDNTVDQFYSLVNLFDLIDNQYMSGGKYASQMIEYNEDDNFYYINYTDESGNARKSILFAGITITTYWSDTHLGIKSFYPEGTDYASCASSVYHLAYWYASNYAEITSENDLSLEFDFDEGDGEISESLISNYYYALNQQDTLTPVTPGLVAVLKAFIRYFADNVETIGVEIGLSEDQIESIKNGYYEDQWLEFCYYYRHYGAEHEDGVCLETHNPVAGYDWANKLILSLDVEKIKVEDLYTWINGGGLWYSFTPDKSGVYLFYSEVLSLDSDPKIRVMSADGLTTLMEIDDEVRPTVFDDTNTRYNFYYYVELEADVEYRVQLTAPYGHATNYYLYFEYVGESYDFFRVCTTGDGLWIPHINDDGSYDYTSADYDAIDVSLSASDGYYHAIVDNDYGSIVYIDFLNPNYYDIKNNSLLDMINGGKFNLRDYGGEDYTGLLLEYYDKSIAGKDEDDELYGYLPADEKIVEIISDFILTETGDGYETKAWLKFACYYEHFGL